MNGPTDSQHAVSWACRTLRMLDVSFKSEGGAWIVPDAADPGFVLICETVGQLCQAARAWVERRREERAAIREAVASAMKVTP